MQSKIQAKIGRPQNQPIEKQFMRKLSRKHFSINSQSDLLAALCHHSFNIMKKTQLKQKHKGKLLPKMKTDFQLVQSVDIGCFSVQQKKELYQKCQQVSKTYEFHEFDFDSMPNQLFTDESDLSFILKYIICQRSPTFDAITTQQLIFIAVYCLRYKVLTDKLIAFLNSNMSFILEGVSYGLAMIEDRLSMKQGQYQQQNIQMQQNESDLLYSEGNEERNDAEGRHDSGQQQYLGNLLQDQIIQQIQNQQQDVRATARKDPRPYHRSRLQKGKVKMIQKNDKKKKKPKKQKTRVQSVLSEEDAKKICIHFINYICYSLYYILEEPNNSNEIKREQKKINQIDDQKISQQIIDSKINSMKTGISFKNTDSNMCCSNVNMEICSSKWDINEIFEE